MRFINSCVYNGYFYFLPSAQSHAFKALTSILLEFDNPHCWENLDHCIEYFESQWLNQKLFLFLIWVHLSLYTFLLAPHFAISHLEYKTRMKQTNQSKENPFFIFFHNINLLFNNQYPQSYTISLSTKKLCGHQ